MKALFEMRNHHSPSYWGDPYKKGRERQNGVKALFFSFFTLSCYGSAFDSAASPDGRWWRGPFLEKMDIARSK